jgi:uncharacterized protein YjgD (DUF1641 family)
MNNDMQIQINELNRKMDLVLDYVQTRESKAMQTDDLIKDVSIVGKDMYDSLVFSLDQQQVELNPDSLKYLGIKLLRNIETLSQMIDMLESINDLLNDASPLVREGIIDFSNFLNKLNNKGYFDMLEAFIKSMDKIVEIADPETINKIGENAEILGAIGKNLTDKKLLEGTNQLIEALKQTAQNKVKPVSPYKLVFKANSPEIKQATGFLMELLLNMNKNQ